MDTRRHDRGISGRDAIRTFGILARDHFHDGFEPSLPVARIDPFRRIAELEVDPLPQPRCLGEARAAEFAGQAGIDRRFEDDDRAGEQARPCRLRERARLYRPVEIQDYTFTPAAWTEVFWDSRFGAFSRYRLGLGANLPIYRAMSVQPYYMREVNFQGSNTIDNIFGMAVITSF